MRNIIIYCRESRDDGFANYERIETQRDILMAYCKKKELGHITDIIMDDNKSGTDFERLEPIKERIMNNEADVLLMKDASRLGRNILESLRFTAFLDEHGIELIFESERYDEDMFPLIAWFNERRAKDDSVKIRRVLRHKMEEGDIVIKAPYGYVKQGNLLIVDDGPARTVKDIFSLFLCGHGKKEIAAILNSKGIPTPSQLKKQYTESNLSPVWNRQHIDRILRHVAYTGDMPYGMRKKISFKSKKYQKVDKKDWIIVRNHHEAIITKEEFEAAQTILKKGSAEGVRKCTDNPFAGLLYCGGCGSRMYRKTQNGKSPWYTCGKYSRTGGCRSHRVREDILDENISEYISCLISAPELKDAMRAAICERDISCERKKREACSIENKLVALRTKASMVYDDKLEGRLPEYLFDEKLREITNEIGGLTRTLSEIEQAQLNMREPTNYDDKLQSLASALTKKMVRNSVARLLFDRIIIFNAFEITLETMKRYGLEDKEYNCLYENGGILFSLNFRSH